MSELPEIIVEEVLLETTVKAALKSVGQARISKELYSSSSEWLLKFVTNDEYQIKGNHGLEGRAQSGGHYDLTDLIRDDIVEQVFEPNIEYYFNTLVSLSDILDAVSEISSLSTRSKIIEKVQSVFNTWNDEVSSLQEATERWSYNPYEIEKHSLQNNRMTEVLSLVEVCRTPSSLVSFGFSQKPEIETRSIVATSIFWELAVSIDGRGRGSRYDLEHIIRENRRSRERNAKLPVFTSWLKRLDSKLDGADPFEPYNKIGKVDEKFIDLISHHQFDEFSSPYLEAFKKRFNTFSYYDFNIRSNVTQTEWAKLVQVISTNFDAKIKTKFMDNPSLAELANIQLMYEKHCLEDLAYYLFNKSYVKEKSTKIEDFNRLISDATSILIKKGYYVTLPSEARLKKLLLLIKDSHYITGQW